jgi:hypothetical protein
MKKVLMSLTIILLSVLLSGCVSASYTTADGSRLKYFRAGDQKLGDVKVETPDGVKLEIGSQEANPIEIWKAAFDLGKKMADVVD